MDPDLLGTILIGIIAGLFVFLWRRQRSNLPPGPAGLPIVGYLPFLGKKSYEVLHQLTLKYGPIYSFYLGRKLVVVLGSFKTVKEVLTKPEFLDRPARPPNHILPDSTSLTVTNGDTWKEQRNFSFHLLRELGMGKTRMLEIIQDEIKYLLEEVEKKKGKPFNLDTLLIPSVSNNIYTVMCGQHLDFQDEERKLLNDVMSMMTQYFRPTIAHAYFPWLIYLFSPLKIWGYDRLSRIMTNFTHLMEKKMSAWMTMENKEAVNTYIDGFMLKMHSQKSASFTKQMLKGNFLSIFGAGSTPAKATVAWALTCMVRYPEMQAKVQEELDKALGDKDQVVWSDRHQLPYTMATIKEVMRSNSTVPISMLRCASIDTKIGSYDIPKGTYIMTNIWGVHHNPDYWPDPDLFQPERFIKDGKVIKSPALISFSYGKRNCPGEDLANMIVFLYISNILRNFTICRPPNANQEFKVIFGIASLVQLDNICLIKR